MDPNQINKYANMAVNNYGDRVVKIVFPYDLDMLQKIRTIPGRRYHAEIKSWSAPIQVATLNDLIEWGFTLDDHLQKVLEKVETKIQEIKIVGIPGLKGTLRPFQSLAPAFIDSRNGRALLADEMGLGKGIETLAWIQLHRDRVPIIIVVPASLKLNWQREAENWIPDPNTEILSGTKPWKTTGDILIINYDILYAWIIELKRRKPQVLVTDECHKYKNNKAQRTKAVIKLAKGIPYFLALSGTPIENRPVEIYNAVNLTDPTIFPSRWQFLQYYCAAKHNGFGWDFNGASHIQELHKRLTDTIMIRRLKKDVLPELPDKVYSFVPMELNNQKEYNEAESNFIQYIKRTKGEQAGEKASNAETLASIEGLKQLAVNGKLDDSIQWIADFLETDGKLVVFATHKFVIQTLMEKFRDIAVKIDGSVTTADRQRSVDIFQHNPKIRLFVGNIKAAGVGITLTAASNVAFLEYPWTSGALNQATDRVHRIGQKDSVNVHYLIAINTIEEKIIKLLSEKAKVLEQVLDGVVGETSNMLQDLLREFEK